MGAEQRTEGSELKLSQIQLRSKVFRRDEGSDIGSPVWNAGGRGVDRNGNLRLECLPLGIHGLQTTRTRRSVACLHSGVAHKDAR
jgi:hypothetical protein